MGLFDRLRAVGGSRPEAAAPPRSAPRTVAVQLLGGDEDLEIVGEANYQDALWAICGGVPGGDRIRHDVVGVLVPEPENPYDENAVCVRVDGHCVGYLDRRTAVEYGPGIRRLMQRYQAYIALNGVIVGGGIREDGPGMLGVWLRHDPTDFGLAPRWPAPAPPATGGGTMRTGLSAAMATDDEDDSYDLSWYDDLPDDNLQAIKVLRRLLGSETDPLDRHYQFAELESRLYRCRDIFASALDEYDAVCVAHDAEMEQIRDAFLAKWGEIPRLETYRQMAIRQQKKKDWAACLWWIERGLSLYGSDAAREDAVEDLRRRRDRALRKLQPS